MSAEPAVFDRVRTLAGTEGEILTMRRQLPKVALDQSRVIPATWIVVLRLDGGGLIHVSCSLDELTKIGGDR